MVTGNHAIDAGIGDNFVADCVHFPAEPTRVTQIGVLAAAAAVGIGGGLAIAGTSAIAGAAWVVLTGAAFAGGLLSTWSPCGYSSISLLRPTGKGGRALLDWLPTFLAHGAGYAAGAIMLGALLGAIGLVMGFAGIGSGLALAVLAVIGLAYGAHQLGLLRVPYPQRRAQVPHDARNRFPKWVVGGLYGLSLGLDYLTYVQTPLLYLTTAAAIMTGNIPAAIGLIAVFNLGRYLPVAVNLMPWKDHQIQAWLARHQHRAALVDGALLTAVGAVFGVLALV